MRIVQRIHGKLNWSKRRYVGLFVGILAVGYLSSAVYHTVKPLPVGLDVTSPLRSAEVTFLSDQTYINTQGKQQQVQSIFDYMLKMIEGAKTTIVLDMFLFNSEIGDLKQPQRHLTEELTQALIKKKKLNPEMSITVLTDPINSVYGGMVPEHYIQLRRVGIDLIETNLRPLRASNPVWSGFWYLCCQFTQNNPQGGWLPNPFGQSKITLRSYLELGNFRANHRKTLVVDGSEGWSALVTSQNAHDGSSHHDNVGLVVKGAPAIDVLNSEQPVARISSGEVPVIVVGQNQNQNNLPQVQLLTEQSIYRAVIKLIETAKTQDQIDLVMFYLSERHVIDALKQAQQRGVKIRVLLDPNNDAFGHQKNGIPNRPVAAELHQAGIDVRWCDTHGEQCHSKMIIKHHAQDSEMILGSANFTARNLKNYNLESDLRVIGASKFSVFIDAQKYFETEWSNLNGQQTSVEYSKYADESKIKYGMYRFMEWSGISTF